jgi:hypothetical protein
VREKTEFSESLTSHLRFIAPKISSPTDLKACLPTQLQRSQAGLTELLSELNPLIQPVALY